MVVLLSNLSLSFIPPFPLAMVSEEDSLLFTPYYIYYIVVDEASFFNSVSASRSMTRFYDQSNPRLFLVFGTGEERANTKQ